MNNLFKPISLNVLRLGNKVLDGDNVDKLNEYAAGEYTSFEVYPHNVNIESGEVDQDTGLAYAVAVPANMHLAIRFYTYKSKLSDVNIQIDVGEDSFNLSELSSYNASNQDQFETDDYPYIYNFSYYNDFQYSSFYFNYKYSTPGKHIVKIYGNDYFLIRCGGSLLGLNAENHQQISISPIISRIFEADLKTSSNFVNASSICNGSKLIQRLLIPYEYNFKNIANLANAFKNCSNLIVADCSDGVIMNKLQAFGAIFQGCTNLEGDISLLYNIFRNGSEDMNYNNIFYNTKLSCSNYDELAKIFWNNPIVNVSTSLSAFLNCNNLNALHIPENWGGILNVDNYHTGLIEEQNQQNELINIFMKYALPNGNLINTASNGYQFTEGDGSTIIDYQGNKASSSQLSTNVELLQVKKVDSSITAINRHGLAYCINLTEFDGSNANILSVGYAAFISDSNLEIVKGLEKITILERNTFNSCRHLYSINDNNTFPEVIAFNNNAAAYYFFNSCSSLTSISFPKLTINGLLSTLSETAQSYAFRGTAFKEINLPSITESEYLENRNSWTTYIPSGCSVHLSNDIVVVKE